MDAEDLDQLPSLTAFHRYLCALDYYADFKDKLDSVNGSPELQEAERPRVGEKIKLKFDSAHEYIAEWEEMFFLEAKAQIIRGGTTEKLPTDEFFLKSVESDDAFYIMTFHLRENRGNTYRIYDFCILALDDVAPDSLARHAPRHAPHLCRRLLRRGHAQAQVLHGQRLQALQNILRAAPRRLRLEGAEGLQHGHSAPRVPRHPLASQTQLRGHHSQPRRGRRAAARVLRDTREAPRSARTALQRLAVHRHQEQPQKNRHHAHPRSTRHRQDEHDPGHSLGAAQHQRQA